MTDHVATRRFLLTLTLTACAAVFAVALPSDAATESLDGFVAKKMRQAHVPGLGLAAVQRGRVVWAKGYGSADPGRGTQATADTPFLLASISKTVTATALMQLRDDGLFDLDDPIDDVLDFEVLNPRLEKGPRRKDGSRREGGSITFRHVLGHASGIRDNPRFVDVSYADGDFPSPLGEVMRDYFTPGRRYWSARRNFLPAAPGRRRKYSNVGYGLAGHLVEALGGRSLEEHCRERIFEPLGMTRTSWFIGNLDPADVAMPSRYDRRRRRFSPYGHYGFADYPSGQLRTSSRHLARFFASMMGGTGSPRDTLLLSASSVREMREPSFPRLGRGYGLGLVSTRIGGEWLIGHDGAESGVSTLAFFRRDEVTGVVLLANGDAARPSEDRALRAIFRRVLRELDAGSLVPDRVSAR